MARLRNDTESRPEATVYPSIRSGRMSDVAAWTRQDRRRRQRLLKGEPVLIPGVFIGESAPAVWLWRDDAFVDASPDETAWLLNTGASTIPANVYPTAPTRGEEA